MITIANKPSNPDLHTGDSYSIKLSMFDQYKFFTLHSADKKLLNISNVGTLFLHFIDESSDIAIPECTEVSNYDKSNGEVVFFISSENAKKILKMNTESYHITCRYVDNTTSAVETELFSGKFKSVDSPSQDLIEYINDLKARNEELTKANSDYLTTINEQQDSITALNTEIESLKASLSQMSLELAKYGDNTIEASFDLKDYISVLAKKGKNSKLTESMMSDIANQMISKNI